MLDEELQEYFRTHPKALAVYTVLTDIEFFDKPKTQQAEEAGVSRATLYKYLDDKEFMKHVHNKVHSRLDDEFFEVLKALYRSAKIVGPGGTKDRQLYMEYFKKYTPELNVNNKITQIILDFEDETEEDEKELNTKIHSDD